MSSGTPPEDDLVDPDSALSDWTKSAEKSRPSPGVERSFTPGTLLANRYRMVALLGRGGMGEVYRAEDTKLGQPVALKFMRGTLSPEMRERLYAEVRVGRQVSHPNVCRLYDVTEFEGETFLTMEYVDGEDLGSLLSRIGRLAPDKALDLARDLCAGLAAVHDKGVVHRDLKPPNVMVDGRGQARLTDFGLALAQDAPRAGGIAGTPAYMAPEQLEGKEPTPQGDLYALGLILFEMFTGRRFFDAKTLPDLKAQHREPKASRLSSGARQMEPLVERAILQCLEEDPAARPRSARAVLAMLPGGDPLDAAVAAGETPSPELVAAAARVGDLSPAAAWALLVFALGVLVLVAHAFDRTRLVSRHTLPKTPEWLAERAREVLHRLGHADGADAAYAFELDRDYLAHVLRDSTPEQWRTFEVRHFAPFHFYYRTSPRRLVAANRDGVVRREDPPPDVSGMADVVLDAKGRLVSYTRVPPQIEASAGPWAEPEWSALFAEARLEPPRFEAASPQWAAPVDSDRKAAWSGPCPDEPDHAIRVEAAAYHGRPVWFAVLHPWSPAHRMVAATPRSSPTPVGQAGVVILALAMPVGGVILARRNLRLGRGDRKGAFRVAVFVFVAYSFARLFRADHVTTFGDELWILIKVFAYPAFWGLQVWLLYIALEPYARRRWPHMLISWKRLLTGSWRDPLVGRDVLLGCALGHLALLLFLASLFGPAWFGVAPPPPPHFALGETLTSFRDVGFRVFVNQFSAVLFGLVFLFMLVLLRVLLRNTALAIVVWCLFVGIPVSGYMTYGWAFGIARSLVLLLALRTGGLLSLTVTLFVMFVLLEAPLTLDLSAWFVVRALPVVALVEGLAIYGFRTALAGKPLFGRPLLED